MAAAAKPAEQPHNNKEHLKALSIDCGATLDSRWQLHELIASGGFGQIFSATDLLQHHRETLAVKVEPRDATMTLLPVEAECLGDVNARLPGSQHFVTLLHFGQTTRVRYLVMTRAGRNLRDVKKATRGDRLSTRASLTLGYILIGAIEQLHSIGWLHRDVKPSNFCLYERPCGQVLMIDFGLARRYLDQDGQHKLPREHSGFHGTTRYASPRTHRHCDMGRCDDVWPLYFMLIEMLLGQLPWRLISHKDTVLRQKEGVDFDGVLPRLLSLTALRQTLNAGGFRTQINYGNIAQSFLDDMHLTGELDQINQAYLDPQVEAHFQLCHLPNNVPLAGPLLLMSSASARSNTFTSCASSTVCNNAEHTR